MLSNLKYLEIEMIIIAQTAGVTVGIWFWSMFPLFPIALYIIFVLVTLVYSIVLTVTWFLTEIEEIRNERANIN